MALCAKFQVILLIVWYIYPTLGQTPPHCVADGPLVVKDEGTIASPDWGITPYENSLNCSWLIIAESRQRILAQVQYNIERCNPTYCSCDRLVIYDGYGSSQNEKYRLCGNHISTALVLLPSTHNEMYVTFWTDKDIQYDGFTMTFTFDGPKDITLSGNEIGFAVGSNKDIDGPTSRVLYDITMNPQDYYNLTDNEFVAPTYGLYLFSYSVGANAGISFNASIVRNVGSPLGHLYGTTTNIRYIRTRTRTVLATLLADERVWTSSEQGLSSSETTLETGFSGYLVPSSIYFYAVQNYHMQSETATTVKHNGLKENSGGTYDPITGQFTVIVPGYYYVFASMGVPKSAMSILDLEISSVHSNDTEGLRLGVFGENRDGSDIACRGYFLHVEQDSLISLKLGEQQALFSDPTHQQTSFGAFLVRSDETLGNFTGFQAEQDFLRYSRSSKLKFDHIRHNVGEGFSSSNDSYQVVVPGMYHVEFGLGTNDGSIPTKMCLMKNSVTVACVYRDRGSPLLEASTGRVLVLDLRLGDELFIDMFGVGSSYNIYWTMFLLYNL